MDKKLKSNNKSYQYKKDNKSFQYTVTVPVKQEEIGKLAERIAKINPFIIKYKREGINFPSEKDHWKTFEKKNLTIALNVLHAKKEKKYPAHVSKHNSNPKKQVILLMIQNKEKCEVKYEGREAKSEVRRRWHYLLVKELSELLLIIIIKNYYYYELFLRGITSKNNGNFYCLNYLYSFRTKKKLESHKKVCENKDFCNEIMLSEDTKILAFSQYQKPDKAPFIIYADLECIIEKTDGYKIILKIHPQQKQAGILYQVFQCLQYLNAEA